MRKLLVAYCSALHLHSFQTGTNEIQEIREYDRDCSKYIHYARQFEG